MRALASIWMFPDRPVEDLVKAAQAAEDAGLDRIWVGDEGVAREPFTVLAAIGTRTRKIEIGVALANPYLRHPAVTAATAATLAEVARRPVHLTFGVGGRAALAPLGVRAVEPVRHLRRAMRLARGVLTAQPVEGYVPAPGARPQPLVDLWLGGRGPQVAALAGSMADGFFANLVKPMIGPILDQVRFRRSLARPIEVALCLPLVLDEDLREQVRPYLALALTDAPAGAAEAAGMSGADALLAVRELEAGRIREAASLVSDDVLRQIVVEGPPERAARELAALAEQYHVDELGVAVLGDDVVGQVERAAAVLLHAGRLRSAG